MCVAADGNEVTLIALKLEVTPNMSLRDLVDCGASNNFVQRQSLNDRELNYDERETLPTRMTERLATGASVTVIKSVVGITYTLQEVQYDDDFIILDLDDKFDVILDLPWLRRYKPQVSWHRRTIDMPVACSPDVHLMNAMECTLICGYSASECDGLTCDSVVSTTARGHSVSACHTMKPDSGDCIEIQVAPKVHHPRKSSVSGQGCSRARQPPR